MVFASRGKKRTRRKEDKPGEYELKTEQEMLHQKR